MHEFELKSRAEFEAWVRDIPIMIANLQTMMPPEVFESLDFTPRSLITLVTWLLETYDSLDSLKDDPNWVKLTNGIAAYIGEIHVRELSWRWDIAFDDDFAFSLMPLVMDDTGDFRCTHSAVTSTVAFPHRKSVFGGEFYQLLRDSGA